jgi:hypothetical protein
MSKKKVSDQQIQDLVEDFSDGGCEMTDDRDVDGDT